MPSTASSSHEQLYRAKRSPEMVEVPPASFLAIDGTGDPNTSTRCAACVAALYAAAYAIKFAVKKAGGPDEKVAPLEGLWWGAEEAAFSPETKGSWSWTMMIRLPEAAGAELVAATLAATASKKPDVPIGELRVDRFAEGRAAQVMHLGPYAEEGPTIARLHAFVADQGVRPAGKHHEIYLGDPRRTRPDRLRTIIRQPVGPA